MQCYAYISRARNLKIPLRRPKSIFRKTSGYTKVKVTEEDAYLV